jgi:hypothetical protein
MSKWCLDYADRRFIEDAGFVYAVFDSIMRSRLTNLPSTIPFLDVSRQIAPLVQATVRLINHVTQTDFTRSDLRGEVRGAVSVYGRPSFWIEVPVGGHERTVYNILFQASHCHARHEDASWPNTHPSAVGAAHSRCVTLLSTLLGWGNFPSRTGLFGPVRAFVGSIVRKEGRDRMLNVVIWLDEAPGFAPGHSDTYPTLDSLFGSSYRIRSFRGEACSLSVSTSVLHNLAETELPQRFVTDHMSTLFAALQSDQTTQVSELVRLCAYDVLSDREFSSVEMLELLLGLGGSYASHRFSDLDWDALVGMLHRCFHVGDGER